MPAETHRAHEILTSMIASASTDDLTALQRLFQEWHQETGQKRPTAHHPAGSDHAMQKVMDKAASHDACQTIGFLMQNHLPVRASAVQLAVARKAFRSLDVLLGRGGWEINAPLDQHTPSILALAYRSDKLVEWLLARGADPMVISPMGRTPLDFLAQFAPVESVRRALDHGGRPQDCYALHAAAKGRAPRRLEVVKLLVDHGASVNILEYQNDPTNYERWKGSPLGTPLHYAARFCSADVVDYLLQVGANETLVDSVGNHPLAWAERGKKEANLELLKRNGSYQSEISRPVKENVEYHQLAKRVESTNIITVLHDSSKTTYVGTGDWDYKSFEEGDLPLYIGTAGLDGCTAVVIANSKGCMLAHFLPDVEKSPTNKWRDGLEAAFSEHADKLSGASAVIVAAQEFEGDGLEFQWQANEISSWLQTEQNMASQIAKYAMAVMMDDDYEDVEQDEVGPENVALGTVLVEMETRGKQPLLYVAGKAQC